MNIRTQLKKVTCVYFKNIGYPKLFLKEEAFLIVECIATWKKIGNIK